MGRGTPGLLGGTPILSDHAFRAHWWPAVASVTRMVGDLATAEDAVQEAFLAAVEQWPTQGAPANPRSWLIGVARHKALDAIRREARRDTKETAAQRDWAAARPAGPIGPVPDDDVLGLVFMCCHPALEVSVRVALTLRSVCGLSAAEVAAVFLVPEATMAKRLTRAKRKIRDAGIRLRVPPPDSLTERLDAVLRVVFLVFTEGHKASTGSTLVRESLCDTGVELARALLALLPDEPEVAGLVALLLLTDARRAARVDPAGNLVLLADQDRGLWNRDLIREGEHLLEGALRAGRPGPYQLHAAIAACHSTAPYAGDTDWRQIALLYAELLRHEPTPVIEANRAIAVAMVDGPAAGLAILDRLSDHPQLGHWPQLHIARADLLRRLGRADEAVDAYRAALRFELSAAERAFIRRRIVQLSPNADAGRP
ncbi:sigma-70 family RNA polymerase sigma factor [Rugosimonospora africana]|uniref:sigma-70 family RNA polymerase sigma factor n=1 Tax=Rugosimonospora africana TaxID=556532 RepID=UPI0027E58CDD|nr:sigma-70 family RNA polymerase sigma factor [Rugosimonospora africana]